MLLLLTCAIISTFIVNSLQECDFVEKTFSCNGGDSQSLMFDFNSRNTKNVQIEEMKFEKLKYSLVETFFESVDDSVKSNITTIRIIHCDVDTVSDKIANNYPNLKILDLSENNIENLDFVPNLNKDLEELYLRNNKMSTIPDTLSNLQKLKVIDVSFCNIENVDFMAFKNNPNLLLVNVSHNKIDTTGSEEYLKNIKCVDLSYNKITKYTNIPSLCLDFSYTDMSGYHWYNIAELNKTVKIEKFYFSGNQQLKLLATNVKNESLPMEITYLNLSHFKGDVSGDLNLEKVKVRTLLTLQHSNIDVLDRSKYDFQPLFFSEGTNATFDLSYCSINDISGDYFQNYNLGRLNLCHNNFTVLKNSSFKDAYIVQLDLCNSGIQEIEDDALLGLHVSTLNLSNNKLQNLKFLKAMNTLRYVDLSSNNIKVIYANEFQNLKDLRKIYLGSNDIASVERNSFALSNIEVVDLSNNKLKEIKNGTFVNINSLREVYLEDNNIENVENGAFGHLPSLQVVNLGETDVYVIKPKAFTNVQSQNFNKIYLKNNEISDLHLVCKVFK